MGLPMQSCHISFFASWSSQSNILNAITMLFFITDSYFFSSPFIRVTDGGRRDKSWVIKCSGKNQYGYLANVKRQNVYNALETLAIQIELARKYMAIINSLELKIPRIIWNVNKFSRHGKEEHMYPIKSGHQPSHSYYRALIMRPQLLPGKCMYTAVYELWIVGTTTTNSSPSMGKPVKLIAEHGRPS